MLNASELPEQYREPFAASFPIRQQQHAELDAYLDRLITSGAENRAAFFAPDFSSPAAYERSLEPHRRQFLRMLGYPPDQATKNAPPRFERIGRDRHADLYRVWTEVLEGVEVYGIYMTPRDHAGKLPLLITQHGGGGCPEAICDLDTRVNYHSFGPEAVKRGYAVWAPFVLMQVGYGGDPDLEANRRALDRKARLVGTSIVGIELFKIARGLESILRARPEIDPERVGMTGLSWGGYYTLHAMAAISTIKVGVCSGIFGEWKRGPSIPEMQFPDIASTFGLVQVAGLICPRPLMIQNGIADTVVPIAGARKGAPLVASFYERLDIADRFAYSEHPGGHEYDNETLFAFFAKHL